MNKLNKPFISFSQIGNWPVTFGCNSMMRFQSKELKESARTSIGSCASYFSTSC
uniref:Uncharacterized protein n=1 Tax=Rhizophora mucronata TaxID=61149 RepID=A0A2P2IRE1_RHIMU